MAPRLLAPGDPVVFVDRRRRSYYAELAPGATTNARGKLLAHDDVIGAEDGVIIRSPGRVAFHVFLATYTEHVLNMKRHAQIVYPKDAALIALWADLHPGATVVEGGFGSGALTMAILRAIGAGGRLTTYELHAEPAGRAVKNVAALLGETPNHTVRLADIYLGIEEREVDRVILDVPEPWEVIPHAITALRSGGILAAYVPTALQVHRLAMALTWSRWFPAVDSYESIVRPWHVTARSVRPEQRIIGHTGFVVVGRKSARELVWVAGSPRNATDNAGDLVEPDEPNG